jgi:hypothetical protein
MKNDAFLLGEELKKKTVIYRLHKPLWDSCNLAGLDFSFSKWKSIKYLDSTGNKLNDEIRTIPNNKGGIYLFFIKCHIITGITEFPFYIGRAQSSNGQNLRKRVSEYFNKFAREDERPKITTMINYWGNELHLAYYTLDENQSIVDLETVYYFL